MKKLGYSLLIGLVAFTACSEEQAKDALDSLESIYDNHVKPTCETSVQTDETQIIGTAVFKAASIEMCTVKIVADFTTNPASGIKTCSNCVKTERYATEKLAMAAWTKLAIADKKLASISGTKITVDMTSDVEGMDYNAMELYMQQMLDTLKRTMSF